MNKLKLLLFILIGLGLLLQNPSKAQSLFAQASPNIKEALVGQPVEVSVTVYTSTWFTKGLDLGNLQVDGAFTLYFRPVSTSTIINGKNYSGVKLIYNVFPYSGENIEFPALNIEVESPPEGDFVGKKQQVSTKAFTIKVNPIPSNFSSSSWLVASGLNVSQHWNKSTHQVKVGEVLERTISRSAYGTVGELIPEIEWDSIPGVSIYPRRASIENNKTKTDISSNREEKVRYLFEKEGEVILPEIAFSWYNSYQKQLYKRTLPEVKIEVLPNPDLGMLATVRDSLSNLQKEPQESQSPKEELTIFGLSPWQFLLAIILGLTFLYLTIRLLKWLFKKLKERRTAYLQSEESYFRTFQRNTKKKDQLQKVNSLYNWLGKLNLKEPTLSYLSKNFGTEKFQNETAKIDKSLGENKFPEISDWSEWEKARFAVKNKSDEPSKAWINPTFNS